MEDISMSSRAVRLVLLVLCLAIAIPAVAEAKYPCGGPWSGAAWCGPWYSGQLRCGSPCDNPWCGMPAWGYAPCGMFVRPGKWVYRGSCGPIKWKCRYKVKAVGCNPKVKKAAKKAEVP